MRQGLVFSIVVLAVFCAPVMAAGGDMGRGTEPLTDGSEDYPWLIEDYADFSRYTDNYWHKRGDHARLECDLDLSLTGHSDWDSMGSSGDPFEGTFDGNGHVISNLDRWLFNYIGSFFRDGGAVSNLVLESVNIANSTYLGSYFGVGSLCRENRGTIINCHSTGTVSSTVYTTRSDYCGIGGLCGINAGTVENCSFTGTVTAPEFTFAGGLCGFNYSTITGCHSSIVVSGRSHVGGLCGGNGGRILMCSSSGEVSGRADVGGLCGSISSMGGLSGVIESSFSTCTVTGVAAVGGLVGVSGSIIVNCYATGVVAGDTLVGGLVGRPHFYGFFIENSFWDVETSSIGNPGDDNYGAIGKTTAQMKTKRTFTDAGWDFIGETANGTEDIWGIHESSDYPRLWWEFTNVPPVADAGADISVFAFADGDAEAQLNGKGSTDADGDVLEYFWYDDAGVLIATGAEPNVLFGIGEYEITLIVNDGIEDSEPNNVYITVLQGNQSPIADAGADQTVYAFAGGYTKVHLDGTGSNDADGDALAYFWYDGNDLIATGAEPNVLFGLGQYEVTLIVNDGIEDSEPNSCVITVVDPFEALAGDIIGLVQHNGVANSLLAKLDAARKKLEDGNENNDGAAAGSLQAFINAVNAQRGKKISEDDADSLITVAEQIISML